jgi:hypothetical protein
MSVIGRLADLVQARKHSSLKIKLCDAVHDGKVTGSRFVAVIDSVTHRPALVNDVPQIDLELDDADDLTDLLNRLEQEASASNKH